MKKIPNIFLIGPMGAGKSSIGRDLARQLKLEFYDTDQEIESRTGADIPWIFDVEGEAGFRVRETKVIDELTQQAGIVLATGGGSIIASDNRNFLAARGVVVYLKASIEQQLKRTAKDKKRPLLQTAQPRDVLEKLKEERESLYDSLADVSFETDGLTVRAVSMKIIKHIMGEQN